MSLDTSRDRRKGNPQRKGVVIKYQRASRGVIELDYQINNLVANLIEWKVEGIHMVW